MFLNKHGNNNKHGFPIIVQKRTISILKFETTTTRSGWRVDFVSAIKHNEQ